MRVDNRWAGDLVHYTKDGRRISVASSWVSLRDAQGRITDVLDGESRPHRAVGA